MPVGEFLDALATASPAPAAGSAAALVLAQAAALCAKAAQLSTRQLGVDRVRILFRGIELVREEATELIDADAQAYRRVIVAARAVRADRAADGAGSEHAAGPDGAADANGNPGGGDEAAAGLAANLAAALSAAADVPMRIVELAAELAGPAADLATAGNPSLRGDATTAALFGKAAATSAASLIAINLADAPGDPRPARSDSMLSRIEELSAEITRRP
jgi:methenyltetrahydrofolate cyclohydrolase